MWTKRLVITAARFSVAATATLTAQSPPPGVRPFKVEYEDGRITQRPIGTSGRVGWTPLFPRAAGDTSREGLQLRALQFEEALAGPKLVVTIALLYGSPMQKRVKVTTVTVTKPAAEEEALDAGTAKQLERVVALLRAAAQTPPSLGVVALRANIAALPVTVPPQESAAVSALGMQGATNAILNDLDEFSRALGAPDSAAYAAWLAASIAKFEAWRQRIVAPVPR